MLFSFQGLYHSPPTATAFHHTTVKMTMRHLVEETQVYFAGFQLQWNPINTTTLGPWKFGRINGVGSHYGATHFKHVAQQS